MSVPYLTNLQVEPETPLQNGSGSCQEKRLRVSLALLKFKLFMGWCVFNFRSMYLNITLLGLLLLGWNILAIIILG